MAGIDETIASNLARYFERKVTCHGDVLRCEPEGYIMEADIESANTPILRHKASGIRVLSEPIDLAEREDRRHPERSCGPVHIVYAYLSSATAFAAIAKFAKREPRVAVEKLVKHEVLNFVTEEVAAVEIYQGDKKVVVVEDGETWLEPITHLDPSDIARRSLMGVVPHRDEPWRGATYCIAFFTPTFTCRSPQGGPLSGRPCEEVLQLHVPERPELEVNQSGFLIQAAGNRDAVKVKNYLELGADPNFVDGRGWNALHTCISSKRPCWPVLELLFEYCASDKAEEHMLIQRTTHGMTPLELAEESNHIDISNFLREKMAKHPKSKHMMTGTVLGSY